MDPRYARWGRRSSGNPECSRDTVARTVVTEAPDLTGATGKEVIIMNQSRSPRPARHRAWAGAISGVLLLGALLLGGIGALGAQAATATDSDPCPAAIAGTQAYAECVARGGDPSPTTTPQGAGRESTTPGFLTAPMWELALSGVVGAAVAGGVMVAARHGGSRPRSAH